MYDARLRQRACADGFAQMEPFYNAAVEDQAVSRAHRRGQTKAVHVYKLYVPGMPFTLQMAELHEVVMSRLLRFSRPDALMDMLAAG